ncbi:MAG: hypothetical protein FJW56_09085 [Actinobacteria bacterium]|nr:hypothetical protein [Actinomycetota bacterium]
MKDQNSKTGKSELNKKCDSKFIPSQTTRNLDFIRKKIQRGFYDLPTVKIFVAEKIVQSLTC